MTQRAKAAQRLLQLLSADVVGDLLDEIDSNEVRRRVRQVQTELRGIADDEAFDQSLERFRQ